MVELNDFSLNSILADAARLREDLGDEFKRRGFHNRTFEALDISDPIKISSPVVAGHRGAA